jgi:hypothetical protein
MVYSAMIREKEILLMGWRHDQRRSAEMFVSIKIAHKRKLPLTLSARWFNMLKIGSAGGRPA